MIEVCVSGAAGRMGQAVVGAVTREQDMRVSMSVDPVLGDAPGAYPDLASALAAGSPEVMVDFTVPDTVFANARTALSAGVHVVIGTTGLSEAQVQELRELAEGGRANALIAPNFAVGAVLLMRFAAEASRHMAKAEIIELHHDRKLDAPSGTALRTAVADGGRSRDPLGAPAGPGGAPGGDPRRARRDAHHPPRLALARELHAGSGAGRARGAHQAGLTLGLEPVLFGD